SECFFEQVFALVRAISEVAREATREVNEIVIQKDSRVNMTCRRGQASTEIVFMSYPPQDVRAASAGASSSELLPPCSPTEAYWAPSGSALSHRSRSCAAFDESGVRRK